MTTSYIPIGQIFEYVVTTIQDHVSHLTRPFALSLKNIFNEWVNLLVHIDPLLLIVASSLIIWFFLSSKMALLNFFGLSLILGMNLWIPAIETIVLVVSASCAIILFGIPIGIFITLYPIFRKIVFPLLDVMQTMPAYIYLIPVIPFFGLGPVTAMIATMIFALPPVIRLTCLGIDQVPKEFLEAADAFGSSKWQKLLKVQLPLASKTILNGINQGIMMSLSMVVLSSLVGAKGLGSVVWRAIQRLEMGLGFEAGIAVVILAILLDRMTKEFAIQRKIYVE